MAIEYRLYGIALTLLYIIYATIQFIRNKTRINNLAASFSAKPITKAAVTGRFGIWGFIDFARAAQNERLVEIQHDQYRLYGTTFEQVFLGTTLLFTIDPENIKAILATKFDDFGLGWSHSRALLRPQFNKTQIAGVNHRELYVKRLIACIPQDGTTFDIQDLFFRFTLDSATKFFFGQSTESLLSVNEPNKDLAAKQKTDMSFADAFKESQDYLAARFRAQKLYWLIDTPGSRRANKIVHRFVDSCIQRAVDQQKFEASISDESTTPDHTFLGELMKVTSDHKIIHDQLLNVLLAGRDTTASLLSWTFYLLARDVRVWTKLRNEVIDAFGTADKPKADVSIEAQPDKQPSKIKILRLYPPVPSNVRTAVKDTVLPKGGGPDGQSPLFVPKGRDVVYMVWTLHRREDIWGPDAALFRPERWAESTPKFWTYLPFNGGPRICLGQQYALSEASYAIVRLLQHFVSLQPADQNIGDPDKHAALTMAHARGVFVKVSPTKSRDD
ncbi:Cytochrome P450 [Lachnellula occidentalis]|uniref:Cytochrome P450 n=1 Tax=Lachnellula occidentalis TaxID=215460 RepID=A0A8H8UHU5_9HELO|nr:Cytochrome P450 [Lachnellula occidentalis]